MMLYIYQWESLLDKNAEEDISKLFLTTHPTPSLQTPSRTSVSMPLTETDSDINALILDYLTMEGYPQAAANFSKEANLQPMQEDPAIRARQEIRNLIHQGQIQDAIESLNDLDSEVCQLSPLVSSFEPSTMIRTRVYTCTTHMAFGSLMINNHFFNEHFPHAASLFNRHLLHDRH